MKIETMEKLAAAALSVSLFAAAAGATSAYLISSPEKLSNLVTAGSIALKLNESNWDEEQASGLTPGSTAAKNPTVKNTGTSDAWMFLRLQIPIETLRLVTDTGEKTTAARTELFSFTAGEAWKLIEKTEKENVMEYVYGYPTITAPQEETAALFSEVVLANYLEGERKGNSAVFRVESIAVQDGLCEPGAGLSEIYAAYCKEEENAAREENELRNPQTEAAPQTEMLTEQEEQTETTKKEVIMG